MPDTSSERVARWALFLALLGVIVLRVTGRL
jgi:hypothetical protein